MVTNRIEREIHIDAPIERVWELITRPEHFAAWYATGGADIEARPGGQMRMRWAEHGEFHAVVERAERPTSFAFRFARLPDEAPRPGNSTLAEFTLTPEGSGTRVRVVETGFAELDIPPDEQSAYSDLEARGWDEGLAALRDRATDATTG